MREPIILNSIRLNHNVQNLFIYCQERPKWQSWYDQVSRAAQSVCLNSAQAFGKGKGHFQQDLLIARGELYEVAAALEIGPQEVCDPLKPVVHSCATNFEQLLFPLHSMLPEVLEDDEQ